MKRLFLVVALFLSLTGSAWADKFYCTVFSQDSRPVKMPQYSHVWGSFVRTDDDGNLKRERTISWAPRGGWHWTDRIKEGYNMTLQESLDFAADNDREVCVWGPVEIEEDFYDRAERQHARHGHYKCIDGLARRWSDPRAVNCIHRLSDVAGGRRLTTHFRYGRCAGEAVYKHFEGRGCLRETSEADRDRVARSMGLNRCKFRQVR